MRIFIATIVGALFGSGLVVSGMTDTTKVQGFLDFFGQWDPTLAFVMAGAMAPMALAWLYTKGRKPVFAPSFPAPAKTDLGPNLIIGSILFGIGWGLAGLCPGPAVASLGFGGLGGGIFFIAMCAGMFIAPQVRSRLDPTPDKV